MSKTEENLKAAFAGESQARNKYTFWAKVARKEGFHYIAKLAVSAGSHFRTLANRSMLHSGSRQVPASKWQVSGLTMQLSHSARLRMQGKQK